MFIIPSIRTRSIPECGLKLVVDRKEEDTFCCRRYWRSATLRFCTRCFVFKPNSPSSYKPIRIHNSFTSGSKRIWIIINCQRLKRKLQKTISFKKILSLYKKLL